VIATGITANGDREVLGLAVGDSEEETFWTEFLRSLRRRGLGVGVAQPSLHLTILALKALAGPTCAVACAGICATTRSKAPRARTMASPSSVSSAARPPIHERCASITASSTSSLACRTAGRAVHRDASATRLPVRREAITRQRQRPAQRGDRLVEAVRPRLTANARVAAAACRILIAAYLGLTAAYLHPAAAPLRPIAIRVRGNVIRDATRRPRA